MRVEFVHPCSMPPTPSCEFLWVRPHCPDLPPVRSAVQFKLWRRCRLHRSRSFQKINLSLPSCKRRVRWTRLDAVKGQFLFEPRERKMVSCVVVCPASRPLAMSTAEAQPSAYDGRDCQSLSPETPANQYRSFREQQVGYEHGGLFYRAARTPSRRWAPLELIS